MPDPTLDQNQDQDQQPQLTLSDLSELHGIARQLAGVGDPRADKIWALLSAQSGDGSAGPSFTIRQTVPQATSWQDDLDNEIGGSEAADTGSSSDTADFLDNLSGIGFHAYFAMRAPDLPAYKGWRKGYFVRDGSGNYVSRDGESIPMMT